MHDVLLPASCAQGWARHNLAADSTGADKPGKNKPIRPSPSPDANDQTACRSHQKHQAHPELLPDHQPHLMNTSSQHFDVDSVKDFYHL